MMCRSFRVASIAFAALAIVALAPALAGPPARTPDLSTPEAAFKALKAAVSANDFEAFRRLYHASTDDLIAWLLDRPNNLHPVLRSLLDERFLAGKESTRDEFAGWLEQHRLTLETVTVNDYYRWRFAHYRSPRIFQEMVDVKWVDIDRATTAATLNYGRPDGPPKVLDLSQDRGDGGRWKLSEVSRVGGCTYGASFEQVERAAVKKKNRHRSPSPAASPSPTSGEAHRR